MTSSHVLLAHSLRKQDVCQKSRRDGSLVHRSVRILVS